MKFYLGLTDINWYIYLSMQDPEDVNSWQPGGNTPFKVLSQDEPFLFKLKSPINAIGGVGFFSSHTTLPLSLAWDVFGRGNGCDSLRELQQIIMPLRKTAAMLTPKLAVLS